MVGVDTFPNNNWLNNQFSKWMLQSWINLVASIVVWVCDWMIEIYGYLMMSNVKVMTLWPFCLVSETQCALLEDQFWLSHLPMHGLGYKVQTNPHQLLVGPVPRSSGYKVPVCISHNAHSFACKIALLLGMYLSSLSSKSSNPLVAFCTTLPKTNSGRMALQ